MARLLRSQPVHYLERPATLEPASVQLEQQTIRVVCVAVLHGGRRDQKRNTENVRGWPVYVVQPPNVLPAARTFPTTPILDQFERANGALGANWTSPLDSNGVTPSVVSNKWSSVGGNGSSYWSAQTFGPNSEVYCLVGTENANYYLYARVTTAGTGAVNGYAVTFTPSADQVTIRKVLAGVYSDLGAAISTPIVSGDQVGFSVVGSTITAYVNGVAVGSRTDTTHAAAGWIGIDLSGGVPADTTRTIDNFGGGSIPVLSQNWTWLRPPMVVNSTTPDQRQQTIRTELAAVQTRTDYQRRAPHSKLRPPTTLEPWAVALRERTIRTWTARIRPRETATVLRPPPPTTPFIAPPIRTQLVEVPDRRGRQRRGDAKHAWATLCDDAILAYDDFNRPNATPPSANWSLLSSDAFGITDNLALVSQQIRCESLGFEGSYWNALRFGSDSEVSIRVAEGLDAGGGGFVVSLQIRISDPTDANLTGYLVDFHSSVAAGGVLMERIDPGTFVPIDSSTDTIQSGDILSLRADGSTITGYINGVPVVSAVDTTYGAGGWISVILSCDAGSHVYADEFEVVGSKPTATWNTGVPFVGLRPPAVIPCPTAPFAPLTKSLVRTRPRRTTHVLFPPVIAPVAEVYYGPRSTLTRIRPRRTRWFLEPPTVLQTFAYGRVALVKTRPRPTVERLRPPTVVRVPSVEQEQQTIRTALVRGRAGKTEYRLFPPSVLAVTYPGPRTTLTQTRPRPTDKTLRPPQVVRIPSVEQEQQTIRSWLVQARPRPTTTVLQPPAVVARPPQDVTLQVVLTKTRPRPTTTVLAAPIFYKATSTIRKALVRARSQTHYQLRPPTVVRVPSVEQDLRTKRVELVRTRPRHTIWQLRPPAVVRFPSVEQQLRTKRITLVETRPRPTHTEIRPPRVLAPFRDNKLRVVLAPARRPKTRNVRPPVILRPPLVTQIRSWLIQTRPQPTTKRLYGPTVVFESVFVNYPLRIWTIAVKARDRFIDRTKAFLRPYGPTRHKGNACLDDFPAAIACLDDLAAAIARLEDDPAAVACLDDVIGNVACLDDQSAAVATLEEEN